MKGKNHRAGRILRYLAVFVLLLVAGIGVGICSSKPAYAKTKVYKIKKASDWKNIAKKKGGKFKLTKDIRLSNKKYYLTIKKNKKYTIDLNGHKVYTTYKGKQLRSVCPLVIEKGTVVLKSSKKNKGVLYSTETAAVTVGGKGKFYLKSGMVVNDAVEFRSNMPSGIYMTDKSKCYLQDSAKVQSIGNGVTMMGSSSLSLTGHPMIRAGANSYTGMFTHYGSGINITNPNCKLTLKGGSIGTKASPDVSYSTIVSTMSYVMSGDYPIYDKNGRTLKAAAGYKFVDARGNNVPITSSFDTFGKMPAWLVSIVNPDKRLTTKVKGSDGFYNIYIVKK